MVVDDASSASSSAAAVGGATVVGDVFVSSQGILESKLLVIFFILGRVVKELHLLVTLQIESYINFQVKRSARLNSWRKNTQNGVFTRSDWTPGYLPRVTCCAMGRIGDSNSRPPHVTLPLNKHVINSGLDQWENASQRSH
ncbi:hypothetical protein Scep_001951 [Stephania cephalantha]|uniref:Uncharacterized protein n=1 Tax=Stephania cephalantha TaxID=152367 RepID=A0AAP0LA41_9MAGN